MVKCKACSKWFDDGIAFGVCPHCGQTYNDESPHKDNTFRDPRWLSKGTVLRGRYVILEGIRYDGFRIIYHAWDRREEVSRTIKEYFQYGVANRIPGTTEVQISAPKRREDFEYGRKRLIDEAKAVSKLQSPGIARVYDCFEENNTSYMVMESIPETSLKELFDKNRQFLKSEFIVKIGEDICEALSEIHEAGMLHRDLSPENIFITKDGNVKIIDFVAARLPAEALNDEYLVLRPGFAPPEQYEKYDPNKQRAWSDIYALGATLYYCLTGIVPPDSVNRRVEDNDPLVELKKRNGEVSDCLNEAVMRALEIDPRLRIPDAESFIKALSGAYVHYQMVREYYHTFWGFGKRHELSAVISDEELEKWHHMSRRKKKKLVEERRKH